MNYTDVIPTHNRLRKPESFDAFVKDPSLILNADKPPLLLRTEDGKCYLNDGHHRMVAACYINLPFEQLTLNIRDITYAQIADINLDVGWVTPYDPRTHVRKDNFFWFKDTMVRVNKEHGSLWATEFIEMFPMAYREERTSFSLKDLVPNGRP